MEEDKITIIEGPPPTFEMIPELWVHGLAEGSTQAGMVVTRLRTLDGPALIERCHHAWRNKQTISLEYRTPDGLPTEAPIVAARHVEIDEGDVLLLWLRLTDDDVELEMGYTSDTDDEDDDDLDLDVMV